MVVVVVVVVTVVVVVVVVEVVVVVGSSVVTTGGGVVVTSVVVVVSSVELSESSVFIQSLSCQLLPSRKQVKYLVILPPACTGQIGMLLFLE